MERKTTKVPNDGIDEASVPGAQAIGRALQLLREVSLSNLNGSSLEDLEKRTQMSKPTIHRMLKQLIACGFVSQGSRRRYFLGLGAYEIGVASTVHFDVRQLCSPEVLDLAQATGDTVFLTIRSGYDVFLADRQSGSYPIKIQVYGVGQRRPLGISASSMALLSFLSEPERMSIYQHNMPKLDKRFSLSALENELPRIRARGYAISVDRVLDGVTGIGTVIHGLSNAPVAAISVASLSHRMTGSHLDNVVDLLRDAQAALNRKFNQKTSHMTS